MATQLQDDELNKQPAGTTDTTTTSAQTGGAGAGSTQTAQVPQKKVGTGFINLQKYIGANSDTSNRMADKLNTESYNADNATRWSVPKTTQNVPFEYNIVNWNEQHPDAPKTGTFKVNTDITKNTDVNDYLNKIKAGQANVDLFKDKEGKLNEGKVVEKGIADTQKQAKDLALNYTGGMNRLDSFIYGDKAKGVMDKAGNYEQTFKDRTGAITKQFGDDVTKAQSDQAGFEALYGAATERGKARVVKEAKDKADAAAAAAAKEAARVAEQARLEKERIKQAEIVKAAQEKEIARIEEEKRIINSIGTGQLAIDPNMPMPTAPLPEVAGRLSTPAPVFNPGQIMIDPILAGWIDPPAPPAPPAPNIPIDINMDDILAGLDFSDLNIFGNGGFIF